MFFIRLVLVLENNQIILQKYAYIRKTLKDSIITSGPILAVRCAFDGRSICIHLPPPSVAAPGAAAVAPFSGLCRGALPGDHHAFAPTPLPRGTPAPPFAAAAPAGAALMGVILFCRKYFCNGR